jgi:hypothetical protein
MLNKLQTLFPNSIISKQKPDDYFSKYHWFSHETDHWIGIPKENLLDDQLTLLKSLFNYYHTNDNSINTSLLAQSWYSYLFENGDFPNVVNEVSYRLNYFQWNSGKISLGDLEGALKAFFESEIILVWENESKGIIVEPKTKQSLTENDFTAMYETLKIDFFIDPYFFVGKFRFMTEEFLPLIRKERSLLEFAIKSFPKERVFQFEKLVPKYLTSHLPNLLKSVIQNDILPVFKEDRELFTTIQAFLQNNMNASITAKNLYIHRNTLQYRLDKFADKTSIPLKDFYSAITVYIACILFEGEE